MREFLCKKEKKKKKKKKEEEEEEEEVLKISGFLGFVHRP
jgi:hypothetical protein